MSIVPAYDTPVCPVCGIPVWDDIHDCPGPRVVTALVSQIARAEVVYLPGDDPDAA